MECSNVHIFINHGYNSGKGLPLGIDGHMEEVCDNFLSLLEAGRVFNYRMFSNYENVINSVYLPKYKVYLNHYLFMECFYIGGKYVCFDIFDQDFLYKHGASTYEKKITFFYVSDVMETFKDFTIAFCGSQKDYERKVWENAK